MRQRISTGAIISLGLALACAIAAFGALAQGPGALKLPAVAPAAADQATGAPAAKLKRIPPREPAEALASFEIHPDFRLELAAHEPLVASPVAGAFDADGRLYVAEMIDYPFRPQPGKPPLGRIRLLTDDDGDGKFDRSQVFVDGLLWPTGVAPWDGGVFVAAAPNIWYCKDTDGDGRADVQRLVFTGFGTQNEQGSVNNLTWGLDNRIYGASSMNGGRVRSNEQPSESGLEVRGGDFCFDPRAPQLELVSGNSQFGIALDDWGNRFLCDQADPCDYVVLPRRYLARNPHLRVATAVDDLSPGPTPIFRSSPIEAWRAIRSSRRLISGERAANSTGLSHDVLDGVAGPGIYRGDAFADEYRGQLFVGDAQNNLVHRRLLSPAGVSFTSSRADEGTEFLRSNDNWFRPVNVINGPDGALYVFDMCREVIESVHVPLDVFQQIDYTQGRDRGRIYRIVPKNFPRPTRPTLSKATTAELVSLLVHRNGWWRDTAQRLLIERADPVAIAPLKELPKSAPLAQTRLHSLYTLHGLNALLPGDLLIALDDQHPALREHAVRLSEAAFASDTAVMDRVLTMADDAAPRVRLQVALSLGELAELPERTNRAVAALSELARHDGADPWTRTAILSSCATTSAQLLTGLIRGTTTEPAAGFAALLPAAAELAGRTASDEQLLQCLEVLAKLPQSNATDNSAATLLGLCAGRRETGRELQELSSRLTSDGQSMYLQTVSGAQKLALDNSASTSARAAAVRLLQIGSFSQARLPIGAVLEFSNAEELHRAAIATAASYRDPEVATLLLPSWNRYAPSVREACLQLLLTRPIWSQALLEAISAGVIPANQVASSQRVALMQHSDTQIAERARAIWSSEHGPRSEVIATYQPAITQHSDSAQGSKIYERECAACHQLGDRGHAVGPNLALARHRTAEELLVHILDPNREVQPAYVQFVVSDTGGGAFAGLIAADTSTSVTLRQDRNVERTILKSEIDELSSTDRSLMPEGFEKTITPAEMGHLIAYLLEIRYQIGTEPGHTEPDRASAHTAPSDSAQ